MPRDQIATRAAPVALASGGLAVLAGSFLPWVVSGLARRNSYAAVQSARRLGVVPDGPWEALALTWFLIPFAIALLGLALATGHRHLAVGSALGAATGAVAFSVVVLLAPVQRGAGPAVTLAGGLCLAAGTIVMNRPARPGADGARTGGRVERPGRSRGRGRGRGCTMASDPCDRA